MAFVDCPEQHRVVQLLQRSLNRGRLAHGYLFTGGQLTELEAVARTLAKTVNCQQSGQRRSHNTPLDCCERCLSCRKIDGFNHPDVQWVRPESKSRVITIEQMRDLMQTIHLKPTEAEYKVAILVAVDRMNVQAANAFLKTLEEPPAKSVLILLSTEPQRMLETILSRCLRLNFAGKSGPPLNAANQTWLKIFSQLAATEQKGLLGKYRLLSALLKRLGELKEEVEKTLTARSPLERYDEIDPRLQEKWEEELAAAIEAEYRRQRTDLLLILHYWLRDVWLQSLQTTGDLLAFPALAFNSGSVAARLKPADAVENLRIIEEAQRLLATNVQEALAVEVSLLKLKL